MNLDDNCSPCRSCGDEQPLPGGTGTPLAASGDGCPWPPELACLAQHAQNCFRDARGSHGWDHTLRVYRLCERIGRAENADLGVLRAAALLHDIGRREEDGCQGRICHALRGAELARPLVNDLDMSPGQRDNILHCIRTHRYRGNQRPETLEAQVLFDADKLDSIGAVGVGRAFLFAGEVGARLHNPDADPSLAVTYGPDDTGYREYIVKLQHIRDRILTSEGRRLAGQRHDFMVRFFNIFLDEFDGKR